MRKWVKYLLSYSLFILEAIWAQMCLFKWNYNIKLTWEQATTFCYFGGYLFRDVQMWNYESDLLKWFYFMKFIGPFGCNYFSSWDLIWEGNWYLSFLFLWIFTSWKCTMDFFLYFILFFSIWIWKKTPGIYLEVKKKGTKKEEEERNKPWWDVEGETCTFPAFCIKTIWKVTKLKI